MPSSDAENRITNGRDEHSSVAGTISSIDDGNDSDDEYFELFQILAAAPINRSSLHTSQQLGQATTQLNSSPLASQRNRKHWSVKPFYKCFWQNTGFLPSMSRPQGTQQNASFQSEKKELVVSTSRFKRRFANSKTPTHFID
ncbi:unnamed protein product [Caenorhabditis angaria]|uniref:Uncharacterized protein n=1 Tax=Caenorhabditis angaria TaxID=860376 RepID=A0A9P1J3Z9_9PELO|nr:unnamed protein product [Caenorhabditis angaria]